MLDELAKQLGYRFIERRDVKAWQQPTGIYLPDRSPVKLSDLRSHLAGERTMGHYLVSPENRCRVLAFDIDLTKEVEVEGGGTINPRDEFLNPNSPWRPALINHLAIMAEGLGRKVNSELDLPVAIAFSGAKGVHVYGFCGSEPASDVRGAALDVLAAFGCFEPARGENFFRHKDGHYPTLEVEVFPKQANLDGKDLGNLMRLPLGVNLKTGKPGMFVRTVLADDGTYSFRKVEPLDALSFTTLPWSDE